MATTTSSSHKILARVLTRQQQSSAKGTTTTTTNATLALRSQLQLCRQLSSSSISTHLTTNERIIRSTQSAQSHNQNQTITRRRQTQIRPYSSSQSPHTAIQFIRTSSGRQSPRYQYQQQPPQPQRQQKQQTNTYAARLFSSGGGKEDFYKLLGVSKDADKGSVKKSIF